jgi:hypothetical protein
MGFGEEELFAEQLVKAGYSIYGCLDVVVEHHFHPSRLMRSSWLDSSIKRGRINAYLTYHWNHRGYKLAWLRLLLAHGQLRAWRTRHGRERGAEGCGEREMRLIFRCAELSFYIKEKRRPWNYDLYGLVKRPGQPGSEHAN